MPARNRLGSKAIATFRGTQEQQSKEYRSMKKFLTVAAIGAALALSGCGKSDDTAATSAGTVKREAGNWTTDIKLVKFEMPGVPDNVKNQMSKQVAAANGTAQYLKPQHAAKDDVALAISQGYGAALCGSQNERSEKRT